jgi:hypothetical protein
MSPFSRIVDPRLTGNRPRQRTNATGWLLGLWLALVLLCLHLPARSAVIALSHAEVTTEMEGARLTEIVNLPYHWDSRHPGQEGHANFTLHFTMAGTATEVWALYIPKLGNAFEIWLNDVPVREMGPLNRHNVEDYSQVPRMVSL